MISALEFVPPNNVQNSFDQLAALIRNQYGNGADAVLDYFEDNYVGRFRVNAPRGIPKFPINFRNMFYREDDKLPRTNNAVEVWHRGSQAHVFACHPILEVPWSVTKGRNCCHSGHFTKWRWPPTSSTKKKIRWLPRSSNNWLFKKYSSYFSWLTFMWAFWVFFGFFFA